MGMFKAACELGVSHGRVKVAGPDSWGEDNTVDLLSPLANPVTFGLPVLSAATSPGGHYLTGALRSTGRGLVEGVGGGLLGAGLGAGLGGLAGGGLAGPLAVAGGIAGLGLGSAHGHYRSRRNQREETGDYRPYGNLTPKDKTAAEVGVEEGKKKSKRPTPVADAHRMVDEEYAKQRGMGRGALLGGALGGWGAAEAAMRSPLDSKYLLPITAGGALLGGALGGYAGHGIGGAVGRADHDLMMAQLMDNPNVARAEVDHPYNSPALHGAIGALAGGALGGFGTGRMAGAGVGAALGGLGGYLNKVNRRDLVAEVLANRDAEE